MVLRDWEYRNVDAEPDRELAVVGVGIGREACF